MMRKQVINSIRDCYRKLSCGCKRVVSLPTCATKIRVDRGSINDVIRQSMRDAPFKPNHSLLIDSYLEAKSYFDDIFGGIRPYHFNDRLNDIAKDTSPGYYYKKLGFKTKAEVVEKCSNKLRYQAHMIKTGKITDINRYPCTVQCVDAKYDIIGERLKRRVVWVYPVEITACENMFFAAIKDRLPDDWVPTPAVYHARFCNKNSGSADYSNFDQHVPEYIIRMAFQIIREWFDFASYAGGARPYSKTSLDTLFDFLRDYFIYTPFITTDGIILNTRSGVPSGSMFTNIVDTIASRIMTTYLHRVNGCDATVNTYGDDVHFRDCLCVSRGGPVLNLVKCARDHFGAILKIVLPNEHGCLTYCKAECHEGQPFHEGVWFRDIIALAPVSFRGDVARCLMHYEPTQLQFNQLAGYAKGKSGTPSKYFRKWKEKLEEFWPKLKAAPSSL